jgi:DNA-directed RNA polymerase subunit H
MTEENLDITKHTLVPKHEKMSEEEFNEVMKAYNVSKTQLPRILVTDPAIERLEVEVGDVIKITRKSPTVGKAYFYRVVVNG